MLTDADVCYTDAGLLEGASGSVALTEKGDVTVVQVRSLRPHTLVV
jgi:hypothetical protein